MPILMPNFSNLVSGPVTRIKEKNSSSGLMRPRDGITSKANRKNHGGLVA